MKRQVLWSALVAVLVLLSLWNLNVMLGQGPNGELFTPLYQAYSLIKDRFYRPEEVEDVHLLQGSLEGLIEQLNDPYSDYFTPEAYERFSRGLEGEFVGIGVHIGIREGRLTIVSPIADSPAARAGARAGDVILTIDGVSTEDMSLDEAVSLLRGERGTEVRVEVRHRDGTIETLVIVRDVIHVPTVETRLLDDGRVGYLKLLTFNENAATDVKLALADFQQAQVQGLILDLRGNSGGLLNQALEVVSQFVDSGLVLTTKGPQGTTSYRSRGNAWENLPLAVLIDGGTASASEIVAGAIQDTQMGVLVGQKSFGKGVVQSLFPLADGSFLKLTTSEYLTPSGRHVQGEGLTPDIAVPDPFELVAEATAALHELRPALLSREARAAVDALLGSLDVLLDPIEADDPAAAERARELLSAFRDDRPLLTETAEDDPTEALEALEQTLSELVAALEGSALRRALAWVRAHFGQRCPCPFQTASR